MTCAQRPRGPETSPSSDSGSRDEGRVRGEDEPATSPQSGQARTAVPDHPLNPDADFAYAIFESIYAGTKDEDAKFTAADRDAAAQQVLKSPNTELSDLVYTAKMRTGAAREAEDVALAVPYIKAGVERASGGDDERTSKLREQLLPEYALHVEEDPQKAVLLKRGSMEDGWTENSGTLNGFAWWCFENKVNLADAREKAARGVELAEDDSQRAMVLDTEAEICNVMDDCEEDVALIKQAIDADPGNDYYEKQLTRFEERWRS